MKTSIQQMTKFLERLEVREKALLHEAQREDSCYSRDRLGLIRVILTEVRRFEQSERTVVKKRPAGPKA